MSTIRWYAATHSNSRCGFVSQSFPNFVIPVYFVYWFNDRFFWPPEWPNVYGFFFALSLLLILYQHTFSATCQKSLHAQNKMFVCDFCYDFICFTFINTNTLFVWWFCHHQPDVIAKFTPWREIADTEHSPMDHTRVHTSHITLVAPCPFLSSSIALNV